MLELTNEVGGHQFGISGLIGDHENLGRARKQINADLAKELPLCLSYVGVAGSDDHVNWLDVFDAEGERRESVCTTDADDLVSAALGHRVEHCRRNPRG